MRLETTTHTEQFRALRNFIQEWIDSQQPRTTWNGLFASAGLSNGSATNWRRGNIKRFPHVETLYRLFDVMGIDRSRLLAVAGMIGEIGEETLRTETAGSLTPREARLIAAYRQLSEGYQSVVFSQVTAMVHAQD